LVNVIGGKAEILDNTGYLCAVEMIGLEFPPLDSVSISFPDVQMLYCFNAANLSEWEKYVLIKSMLVYTKEKSIAKWINWNPADLSRFMSLGRKIEERAIEKELEKNFKENMRLEEFFK